MKPGQILVSALVAVIGLAAVFVAQHWLYQRSHYNGAFVIAVPQVPMKTVMAADRPLRFGTEIKQEHLKEVEWGKAAIPSGAFKSISELLSVEGRRAVLSPIEPNKPVLSWKVTGPGERATLSAVVDDGMRAVSVRINDVLGSGFVQPGDRVDVIRTRSAQGQAPFSEILLHNVKVVAIDLTADKRADHPRSSKTATLEVNTVDVQKLTLAQTAGTLSLAMRAARSVEAAAPRRITMKDLGPASEIGDFPNDPLRCGYPYGRCDAFEIYSVDLLAKNMEESFQAIETRISQMGQEFRGTRPIDTEAMPFNPNASNCASLYALPCRADGMMGPTDGSFSATGCDVSGQRVAKRCRQ